MRHLWTTITTEQTVTHDAGEPEWLDLPLDDFVIPSTPDIEELPVLYELDTPWQLRSKWMMDELDLGFALVPAVEYRDPLGFTLYNEEINLGASEDFYMPLEYTSVPVFAVHRINQLWYTLPGLYTFIVRWLGSPATREVGLFSMMITDPSFGGYDE